MGLLHRRPGGQTRREQQAVLLLHPGKSSEEQSDQRRQSDPASGADGPRAGRRLLADARHQHQWRVDRHPQSLHPGRALHVTLQRLQHGGLLPGRRGRRQHSGGPSVRARPRHPQPVPAAEHDSGDQHDLQLPDGRRWLPGPADGRKPHPAAGHQNRLRHVVEAAADRQVLRPARPPHRDPRTDSRVHGRPHPVSVHHELRRDRELHDEPHDVHRGHVRLHPERTDRRQ